MRKNKKKGEIKLFKRKENDLALISSNLEHKPGSLFTYNNKSFSLISYSTFWKGITIDFFIYLFFRPESQIIL